MSQDEHENLQRRANELEAEVARLQRSDRRQRAIFDSAVDFAILTTDPDGRVTSWNKGAVRTLGWTADEMLGQAAERFFTPEDRAVHRAEIEMQEALRDGRAGDERWHLRKDGTRFWASGGMMPLRDEDGAHLGFTKIVRDRTAEHLAGVALRASEELRKALLKLNDRLIEHDSDTATLADAASAVLGRTLGVQVVGYGLVDPEAEIITVERDWVDGVVASLTGMLNFRDFGSYIDDLKRGETVIVTDARTDPRTSAFAAALEARSARAFVNTPVFEHVRFVALLYVSTDEPRQWGAEELEFIGEVAGRTRAATVRLIAESERRSAEAELRLVVDTLPMMVAFVDRSLTYRVANAGYQDWFDLAPEQVIGRCVPDILSPEGFAARKPFIEKALAGTPARFDLAWPWPDGRRRIADIRYTPRFDARGRVDGFYIFVADITAQRDAETMLAAEKATLTDEVAQRTAERDRLWETTNDLMGAAGFDGYMKTVNPAWTAVLGWSEDEILSRPFAEIIAPADHAETASVVQRLAVGETVSGFVDRVRTRAGDFRIMMWTAVRLRGHRGCRRPVRVACAAVRCAHRPAHH